MIGCAPLSARALGAPTLGHLDPQYLAIIDETCARLREVFRTKNALTFPVSGTGMAGMECIATNLLEPGDEAIVGVTRETHPLLPEKGRRGPGG